MKMDSMREEIEKVLKKYHSTYIEITTDDSMHMIHALLCAGKVIRQPETDIEHVYFGWYYNNIKQDYANAKRYYLMAIEQDNVAAMSNLGNMYENIHHDYDNAKKYYLMAIEHGCVPAMNNLGVLYRNELNDYDNAKKYYLMATEHGNVTSMYNLGYLYKTCHDYDNAKRYFIMAIKHGYLYVGIHDITYCYEQTGDLSFINDLRLLPGCHNQNVYSLFNDLLGGDMDLPPVYHEAFCQWNLQNADVDLKIQNRQYILQKTNIFPSKYRAEHMIAFMELLLLVNDPKCILPKDIMLHIAGLLFV